MAMDKQAALDMALQLYNDYTVVERRRLQRIDDALRPPLDGAGAPTSRVELPDDAPAFLHTLAAEADTNYLPLLVETYAQTMVVDNYITKSDSEANHPWRTWQRNRMDSRQLPLHVSALQYGTGYASAMHGTTDTGDPMAAIKLYTPHTMTAAYRDEEWDDWPEWALARNRSHWYLIGGDEIHTFGVESRFPGAASAPINTRAGHGHLTWLDVNENTLQVVPVVRYEERHRLAGDTTMGIVEPLLPLQKRIDRTSVNQMIAQQVNIFKQKYVVGWVPKDEEEEMKATLAKIHYLDADPSEVEMGEWDASPIDPYISAGNQARRDFAALGQIPAQSMGVDGISNISDATLAGLEAAKNRRSGTFTTSLGESHEQLMRLTATIEGNSAAAQDYSSETVWREFESRSFAQTVDGLVKLVTGVGLPPEIAMEDVPGMSGQRLQRVQTAMRQANSRATLATLRGGATPGTPAPGTPPAPAAPAPGAVDPAMIKAQFDALGAAIRSGVDPQDAARAVGLGPLSFTGAVPVSLRMPKDEATSLENG